MKKFGLIVGADADLPEILLTQFGIQTYSYPVTFGSYTDFSAFYELLRTAAHEGNGVFPQTSQPSKKSFTDLFLPSLINFDDVLVFTISSTLSASYDAACAARKTLLPSEQERIHIIDSRGTSGAQALLVLKAAELAETDSSLSDVLQNIQAAASDMHIIGVLDTPLWLRRGGRISSVQAMLITNMLRAHFRPILTLQEGEIVTKKIQRGAADKAMTLFSEFTQEVSRPENVGKKIEVVITHGDCPNDAEKLRMLLAVEEPGVIVRFINILSPVVGSYMGPNSLILSWLVS